MAKMFNVLSFGLWDIDVPETVTKICEHPTDDIHTEFDHDDLQLGFQVEGLTFGIKVLLTGI